MGTAPLSNPVLDFAEHLIEQAPADQSSPRSCRPLNPGCICGAMRGPASLRSSLVAKSEALHHPCTRRVRQRCSPLA